jgi:glutathione reductase (NADPH)
MVIGMAKIEPGMASKFLRRNPTGRLGIGPVRSLGRSVPISEDKQMADGSFDVVIIGGGNAAMGVTVATREAGLSVAMIEARDLGGVCPNRGCTPKKILVAAAHALDEIERAKVHHISVDPPRLDWAALIDREKAMIRPIPDHLAELMAKRGVEVIHGGGRFVDTDKVAVGDRVLEARHMVIATGSKPRSLPIAGAEHLITSDDVLDERTLPAEIVFIGGGVIALEFAHVYARAGAKVTILEVLPRLLPALDADAVDQIRRESERIGIRILTSVKVERIEPRNSRLRVTFVHDGKEQAIEADRVVNGAGRVADVDALDLAAAKIERSDGRIAIGAFLRSTSNPQVYVCGDSLTGTPQLSPVATYEGQIVGRNIVEGAKHKPDYASIPSCVFTVPALASVGLTEQAARDKGHKVRVKATDMHDWLSSRTYGETVAYAKVLIDETSDRILGAHMAGHAAEELIHFFAFAMAHGITAAQIRDQVFAFPTFSANIKNMV